MELQLEEGALRAVLLDFSRHGLKFSTPESLKPESVIECRLSIPLSLSKEISLTARIRHCTEVEGNYIAGAEIDNVSEDLWFRVFEKVHDFIIDRAGGLY